MSVVVAVTPIPVVVPTVVPIPIVGVVPTSHGSKCLCSKTKTRFSWQGLLLNGLGSWKAEARELYCMSAGPGERKTEYPGSKSSQ